MMEVLEWWSETGGERLVGVGLLGLGGTAAGSRGYVWLVDDAQGSNDFQGYTLRSFRHPFGAGEFS